MSSVNNFDEHTTHFDGMSIVIIMEDIVPIFDGMSSIIITKSILHILMVCQS